jgi:hypothetical protein
MIKVFGNPLSQNTIAIATKSIEMFVISRVTQTKVVK